MIHIQGMGWMGSVLALHLDARRIPFTWNDTEAEFRAWPASTGLCYPCHVGTKPGSDMRSMPDLAVWQRWANGKGVNWPLGTVHTIDFTYSCVNPPHNGPKPRLKGKGWSISSVPAVWVDVPAVVRATRARFGDRRVDGTPEHDLLVRAHGFTERIHRWVWGWNRPVKLDLHPDLVAALNYPGTSIYSRFRYAMAYAYPMVNRPGWYLAGSTLLPQERPHHLRPSQVETQWGLWRKRIAEMAPFVTVEAWGDPIEGWRPQGKPGDAGWPIRRGNVVTYPPLWHSGVRWSPSTITRALELIL